MHLVQQNGTRARVVELHLTLMVGYVFGTFMDFCVNYPKLCSIHVGIRTRL